MCDLEKTLYFFKSKEIFNIYDSFKIKLDHNRWSFNEQTTLKLKKNL